jgi:hypothetical protein
MESTTTLGEVIIEPEQRAKVVLILERVFIFVLQDVMNFIALYPAVDAVTLPQIKSAWQKMKLSHTYSGPTRFLTRTWTDGGGQLLLSDAEFDTFLRSKKTRMNIGKWANGKKGAEQQRCFTVLPRNERKARAKCGAQVVRFESR